MPSHMSMSEPRVRTPAEVGQQHSVGGVIVNAAPPTPRHDACTQCGGFLQGSREYLGVCMNCEFGKGWVVQQVAKKPWMREGWEGYEGATRTGYGEGR